MSRAQEIAMLPLFKHLTKQIGTTAVLNEIGLHLRILPLDFNIVFSFIPRSPK
jgi:hypothetical protein